MVFNACNPLGGAPAWAAGSGARMATRLVSAGASGAVAGSLPHGVPAEPYRGNQLGYAWSRARACGSWLRANRPEGEAFVFVEVVAAASGQVPALHLYVLDREGRIAYHRLWNRHPFGAHPPGDPEAAMDLALGALGRDLSRRPDKPSRRRGPG